jgi:tetratricopeptide (TPR) repeat protein
LWAERGRPERALRQYEALLDQTRRVEAGVYTEMLRLYRETDNEAGAERTLRTLIDRRHNPSVYRRMLGQLYARQDRYREAIPLFETLLSETPNDPSVLSQLKMMYLETGQPEKADRLGLQLNEESATPQQFVAQAQSLYEEAAALDSADTARILRLVRRALDQDPAHAPALDLLGTVRFEQGRYGQAAAAFERAVDENPRDPRRWQRAALAHLRADSVRQAAALAEEGRLLFPGRHELTGIEARAHLRLGAPETARARFRDALSELDSTATPAPERALLHAGLGRALHALGRPGEAARAVDTALRLAPRDATVLSVCARTLADRGESLDRALRYARRAVEVAPSTPEVLGTLGWVQLRRKQYAAARRAFEDALAAGTPDAWVYERFGDLHRALGHPDLARRYWQKALERSPTPDSLQQKLDTTPQSET